jgi:hypothetical protein
MAELKNSPIDMDFALNDLLTLHGDQHMAQRAGDHSRV